MKPSELTSRFAIVISFIFLLYFSFFNLVAISAQGALDNKDPNPRPTTEPTPRPTIIPSPRPTLIPTNTPMPSAPIIGGYIKLHITPPAHQFWTEIEWQDGFENWHKVDGWQGSTIDGEVVWFVGSDIFGQGPFRWLVFDQESRDLLVISDLFYLPTRKNEVIQVYVNLN